MFDELAHYQAPVREVKHTHVPSEGFVQAPNACSNKCSHVQVIIHIVIERFSFDIVNIVLQQAAAHKGRAWWLCR